MNAKVWSARAWCLILMTVATAGGVVAEVKLSNEWWVLFGVVLRDYFGRSDRGNGNGGAA